MTTIYNAGKSRFDDFWVEKLISEPTYNYSLFNQEISDSQSEQLRIFSNLEVNLPLFDGSSFSNQVHFQTVYQIPVQRWFPYREGYSIKLVKSFLNELHISGNVFDPFSGSGTTLLASRHNNLSSFGMDVNPISVLVAKVENAVYSQEDIKSISAELDSYTKISKSKVVLHTSFNLAEKVFNPEILNALLQIKEFIRTIKNQKTQDLFFVAWLAIIESVSNIKKEGNGIKYKNRKRTSNGYISIDKNDWERQTFPEDKFTYVKMKLQKHLEIMFEDIINNYGNNTEPPVVYLGNCIDFNKFFSDEIQFTFFSPPYCNCFDYFEIHKVELWLGDFVKNKEEFRVLRNTGFRSNTNSVEHKPIIYFNENIEKLINLFDIQKLWSPKIPKVIRGYFDDTNSLLRNIYLQTSKGGYVGIVIGNSAYSNVIIPSDLIIAEIASQIGFMVKNIFITRHLTTSSQQKIELNGLKNYLRESIVLLQK